jgi:hypothetical protein
VENNFQHFNYFCVYWKFVGGPLCRRGIGIHPNPPYPYRFVINLLAKCWPTVEFPGKIITNHLFNNPHSNFNINKFLMD